ncbi:Nucleolar protein 6 [Euphorbia peplus]|nr:Nucleolar protein 6 [Euphorbia peplus]
MEVDKIKETMEFKISELLKEVEVDYSPSFTNLVDDTVSAIQQSIATIPHGLPVTSDEASGFVKDIGADKVDFKFKKPDSVEIGGSYLFKSVAKPHVHVDLFIQLPKECFHEKDYLNHRYHAKRCLYLCIIRKFLSSSASIEKVEWSSFQNETRKPVLLVYPAKKLVEVPEFFVRIIPTARNLFNVSKLDLKRNNIRALKQGDLPLPTPRYNSSILEDMFLEDTAKFLNQTFHEWTGLREALVLLKVWARQRSSVYSHDCLNGFLAAAILTYLATYAKINNTMNPLQIFRITMDFMANSKLWSQGLYLRQQREVKVSKEDKLLFKETFPVVLCDSLTQVNLTFRMKKSGFLELQNEAALTLQCLLKSGDNAFEDIFMTKIDFSSKYDYCIRLSLKGNNEVYPSGFCLDDECWRLYEQKVENILSQGLTDRAKSIRVIWRNTYSDCNIENGLSVLDTEPLLIGISISSLEKAMRVVDIGPDAENKEEALKYRKFWGEKAELRRFRDGKIAESTVWETDQWAKHLILKRIIEYVLLRHLSLSKTNVVQVVDQLDFSLLVGVEDPISISASLLSAFEVLSKRLRLVESIPLKVSSVQPIDPAFRFTSVFPPKPHPLAKESGAVPRLNKLISSCVHPLEVMIQLEGSGNWPMDEEAIEKTKSAFLIQIGESLQSSWGMTCNASEDNVDVFLSGYVFRLKILHERGLNLVKKEIGSNKVKRVPSKDKKLFISGQHSSMINGLQGLYPMYGPVARLAKRWVASHLFSACLVEEAIELLVAHLFLKPLPFTPPGSRIVGFLRFLRLISEFDWTFSPLIVDINNDLTPNDKKEIHDNFTLSRTCEENEKNCCSSMFLATSYDKASDAWTSSSPNSSELKRLVAYARSGTNLLSRLILEDQTDSYKWECLFRTPLSNYDAVILLQADKLPYPQRLLFPSNIDQGRLVARGSPSKAFHPFILPGDMKKSSLDELKNKLMVNFDPLRCYIGDVQAKFKTLKLWYDSLGGDAIGLTWDAKKRKRDEESEVEEDPIGLLKAVGEAGKGFVRSVYYVKAPRLLN